MLFDWFSVVIDYSHHTRPETRKMLLEQKKKEEAKWQNKMSTPVVSHIISYFPYSSFRYRINLVALMSLSTANNEKKKNFHKRKFKERIKNQAMRKRSIGFMSVIRYSTRQTIAIIIKETLHRIVTVRSLQHFFKTNA